MGRGEGHAAEAASGRPHDGGQEGVGMEVTEAAHTTPTAAELERAIVSVPGVADAAVHRDDATGRSRLRLRLAPGEDADSVSWSVAATLRERFGIALDPDAIRPLPSGTDTEVAGDPEAAGSSEVAGRTEAAPDSQRAGGGEVASEAEDAVETESPTDDPVRLVDDGGPATTDGDRSSSAAADALEHVLLGRGDPHAVPPRSHDTAELRATRERLTAAATEALRAAGELEEPLAVAAVVATSPPDAAPDTDAVPDTDAAPASAGPDASPASAAPDASPAAAPEAAPAVHDASRAASGAAPGLPADAESADADADDDDLPPEPLRAAIRHLDTQRDDTDVRVTATLELDGRIGHGRARSIPTMHGTMRAVAEATVAALRDVVDDRLLLGIDRVTLHPAPEPSMATVVVTLLTDRGEETLLGGSLVRGDPERAVMRATLDALNRRVASLLTS